MSNANRVTIEFQRPLTFNTKQKEMESFIKLLARLIAIRHRKNAGNEPAEQSPRFSAGKAGEIE
ncbi:hypothetical protein BH11PLA2_BH11PLA2_30910 [soil metagenome]